MNFNLTDEQKMLQGTAREFAVGEIAPAAEAVRRAAHSTTPWDIVKPVFAQGADLGFTRLIIPEAYGGLGGSCLDNVLVMEEFGAADHGIAASYFNVSMTAPAALIFGGSETQKRRWLGEIAESRDYVLASASSEPDVAGGDSFYAGSDPDIGLKTSARLAGDHYVLNGRKAGFSTNAPAARLFFVMARTALDRPARESTSMFLVPAGTPGLEIGGRTHLIGWKTAVHAEVLLDNVEVPLDNRIGAEGANAAIFFLKTLPYLAAGFAATFVGLARAAFDLAFSYAHDRKSWGRPIADHQAVALKLADMLVEIEAARLMVWRLAVAADAGDPAAAALYAPAAKTVAVETAVRCAERAIKVMGGYGVAEEYGAGRMLADAWIGDSCDGTHDMLRLNMINSLRVVRGLVAPPGLPSSPPNAPPGFVPEKLSGHAETEVSAL